VQDLIQGTRKWTSWHRLIFGFSGVQVGSASKSECHLQAWRHSCSLFAHLLRTISVVSSLSFIKSHLKSADKWLLYSKKSVARQRVHNRCFQINELKFGNQPYLIWRVVWIGIIQTNSLCGYGIFWKHYIYNSFEGFSKNENS
jgi:hypothetical protein